MESRELSFEMLNRLENGIVQKNRELFSNLRICLSAKVWVVVSIVAFECEKIVPLQTLLLGMNS